MFLKILSARVYLFGLILLLPFKASAQKKPDIKGNKSVTTFEKALDYFNALQLDESIDITLIKGVEPKVTMVADDNLPAVFKFEVIDSVLHITTFYHIKSKKELNIQIQYPDLKQITMTSGHVNLSLVNDSDAQLAIQINENASMDVSGLLNRLSITSSGRSFVSIRSTMEELEIKQADRAAISATGSLGKVTATLLSHSSLKLEGSADFVTLFANENARIDAAYCVAKTSSVILSGHANASVQTEESMRLALSEQSDLEVYGSPKLQVDSFSGTAKIEKKELKK